MSEDSPDKSVQITLKVPFAFLKEFDEIAALLGYPRNEAIRESMRRFTDWGYQKVNERHPERAMGMMQGMFSALFGGIAAESEKLQNVKALPDKNKEQPRSNRGPKK